MLIFDFTLKGSISTEQTQLTLHVVKPYFTIHLILRKNHHSCSWNLKTGTSATVSVINVLVNPEVRSNT